MPNEKTRGHMTKREFQNKKMLLLSSDSHIRNSRIIMEDLKTKMSPRRLTRIPINHPRGENSLFERVLYEKKIPAFVSLVTSAGIPETSI